MIFQDLIHIEKIIVGRLRKREGDCHILCGYLLSFCEFPEYFLDYREMLDPSMIGIGERAGSGVPDIFQCENKKGGKNRRSKNSMDWIGQF